MALTCNGPALRSARILPALDPIWLAAGAGMAGLAAAVALSVPEQSLAIMAGLFILLLAIADLRTGFLAFVAIYPFMPVTWGIDVAAWMPYLAAQRLCCIALAVVFLARGQAIADTPRVRKAVGLIVALTALQLLCGIASSDPLSAFKRAFDDVVEGYFPLLMAASLFRTKAQVRTLLMTILVAATLVAVLAIIEHSLQYSFYDSFTSVRADINEMLSQVAMTRGPTERRVRVAFFHSVYLGVHLMCVLIAAVYFLPRSGAYVRLFLCAALPLFCLALFYTYSRGPILGLLCGLAWLGLIGRETRSLMLLILCCGIGVYFLMPAKSRDVMAETVDTSTDIQSAKSAGGGTVRARLDLLQVGLRYSGKSLLFGHGPGAVRETQMRADDHTTVDFSAVDNFYLSVLLDYGIFVLVLTVIFFAYLLGTFTWAALRIQDPEMALLMAIAAAVCLANYVALATLQGCIPLFWILLGLALRVADQYQPQWPRRRLPRGRAHSEVNHMRDKAGQRTLPAPAAPVRAATASSPDSARQPARVAGPPAMASMRGPILLMLALGALAAAAPAQAASSFYGTTGLFATPTAEVAPRGVWAVGSNYVGRDYRPGASSIARGTVANFFTLTLIHNLELTLVLTNYEGKLGARNLNHGLTPDFAIGGLTLDRTTSVQWLALPQQGDRPSLAFGMRDFLGRTVKHLRAQYGVMSLNRGRLTLSAGWGTQALAGPFGGVEYALTPQLSAIAEGLHNQQNGGLRLVPLRNVQLDLALMGFRSLGGGLSYRRKF